MLRRRIDIVFLIFLAAGVVLLARLAQMQILWHHLFEEDYYQRAGGDRTVETVRGGIYTRDGLPLARDVPVFDVAVHYPELSEMGWRRQLQALCRAFSEELRKQVEPEELQERVDEITGRVERIWRSVKRRTGLEDLRVVEQEQFHAVLQDVPLELAAAIRTQPERYPSLKVKESAVRRYYNGRLAPHVVGSVGKLTPETWRSVKQEGRVWAPGVRVSKIGANYRQDDFTGISGMEKALEDLLRGRRGYVENRLVFRTLKVAKLSSFTPPEEGRDIYLTLRADLQGAANEALRWAAEEGGFGFKRGAVVIMDVADGSVLAAATYPSYDLDLARYGKYFESLLTSEDHPLLFRPTQAALPIGSIYKIVTAIAGLEEGKITPSTIKHCKGFVEFRGKKFRCTARWGHKNLDLFGAIEKSCNSYFYNVGVAVGAEALANWGQRYGLGQPTGVDLPFEYDGQLPTPRSLFGTLNLSIGQGNLQCTPLQVARMMAAVANGGRLVRPHFFHAAADSEGRAVNRYEPEAKPLEVGAETLDAIRRGLRKVVESGTARGSGLDAFEVAGKTGTAETASHLNHAWFAGFAPFGEPVVAFAVYSEHTTVHGGDVAPIVRKVFEVVPPESLRAKP